MHVKYFHYSENILKYELLRYETAFSICLEQIIENSF